MLQAKNYIILVAFLTVIFLDSSAMNKNTIAVPNTSQPQQNQSIRLLLSFNNENIDNEASLNHIAKKLKQELDTLIQNALNINTKLLKINSAYPSTLVIENDPSKKFFQYDFPFNIETDVRKEFPYNLISTIKLHTKKNLITVIEELPLDCIMLYCPDYRNHCFNEFLKNNKEFKAYIANLPNRAKNNTKIETIVNNNNFIAYKESIENNDNTHSLIDSYNLFNTFKIDSEFKKLLEKLIQYNFKSIYITESEFQFVNWILLLMLKINYKDQSSANLITSGYLREINQTCPPEITGIVQNYHVDTFDNIFKNIKPNSPIEMPISSVSFSMLCQRTPTSAPWRYAIYYDSTNIRILLT